MTSGLGSVTVSGLLGGTAGKIDTDALVKALMEAKSVPKKQLQDKLSDQQKVTSAYQQLNARLQALTKAAEAVTDVGFGTATAVSSSSPGVEAASTAGAATGSSTFTVQQLARAQVSTVAGQGGSVVDTPANGITINGITINDLGSGSAADVAAAINAAARDNPDVGVRAAAIETDAGMVLQLTATKTGTENAFTATGFGNGTVSATEIVSAQDARIAVGDPGNGGYTISSASNTFTDAMPGITFSIGAEAVGQQVTLTVDADTDAIADTVQKMVDAANAAKSGISQATGRGGILQGHFDISTIGLDLGSAISSGTADGRSLSDYGVDIDKNGVITFDAAAFSAAYAADAKGTVDAIAGSLGAQFRDVAQAASAPITGTISQAITSANARADSLNDQIDAWSDRLDHIETRLKQKYIAMQTALAKLQSQSDWLTNMFKAMNGNKDD